MAIDALWEALQRGYYITFSNKSEIQAMLRECEKFDIRWHDGEKPLGYNPGFVPAIDYGTHGNLYCQYDTRYSRSVSWSDLVKSGLPLTHVFCY